MRPAANLRRRLGEDREAGGLGEVGEGLAQLGVELAAGDDHARDRFGDVLGDLLEQEGRGLEVDRGDGGQRPPAAALQGQLVGRRHGSLDGRRRQRLAPGQVEVDGPGTWLAAGGGEGPAGGRAVVQQPLVVGVVGADFAEPAHRRAVELDLVERLAGADPAQLRRPVGGQRDQRQRRLVGLADRRVEVGGGGPRGAEDRHRRPARLRGAEGEEGGGALVDDHGHLDLLPGARAPRRAASSASRGRRPRCRSPQRASSSTKAEASAVLALVGSMRGDLVPL